MVAKGFDLSRLGWSQLWVSLCNKKTWFDQHASPHCGCSHPKHGCFSLFYIGCPPPEKPAKGGIQESKGMVYLWDIRTARLFRQLFHLFCLKLRSGGYCGPACFA